MIRIIGIILLVVGLASAILFFMDKTFVALDWINNWGKQVGWGIRGFMIVLGVLLYVVGKAADEEEAEEEAQEAHRH